MEPIPAQDIDSGLIDCQSRLDCGLRAGPDLRLPPRFQHLQLWILECLTIETVLVVYGQPQNYYIFYDLQSPAVGIWRLSIEMILRLPSKPSTTTTSSISTSPAVDSGVSVNRDGLLASEQAQNHNFTYDLHFSSCGLWRTFNRD